MSNLAKAGLTDTSRSTLPGTSNTEGGLGSTVVALTRKNPHFIRFWPLLSIVVAMTFWFISLRNSDLTKMSDIGLLSVLPLSYYIGLGIVIISSCIVIYQQKAPNFIFYAHMILLIFMVHGTPPILYDGVLRYSWAWKHLGIVDYIHRFHGINNYITSLPAYHNWPGFFTASLFYTEIAGFSTPITYASWAQVFFHLMYLGSAIFIFKTFTTDKRLQWFGILLFLMSNWVGQDYYAPQAVNYFYFLIVVGICVTWLRTSSMPSFATILKWVRIKRVANWVDRIFRHVEETEPARPQDTFQRLGAYVILLLIFIAIASSHQLTPFMTVAAVAGLVVVQRCNARFLPILLGIIAVMWIIYVGYTFVNPTVESVVESLGQLTTNTKLINLAKASLGQRVVAIMGRALTAGVMGLAGLGALRLIHQKQWILSCFILAFMPFTMLAVNSYGGEMIFRVFLFSMPFTSFLGAGLLYPSLARGKSRLTLVFTVLLTFAFVVGYLFAYYGKERQYYFPKDEVSAMEYLYSVAPPNSLFVEASRNYPSQFKNYELYTYVAIDREPVESQESLLADPETTLSRWLSNKKYAATFLIFATSQAAEIDMIGSLANGAPLRAIEDPISASPKFRLIFSSPNARIYVLVDSPIAAADQ